LSHILKINKDISYLKEDRLYLIKGSFLPFILIMGIFFTKFVVGVIVAKQLLIINNMMFILSLTSLYGLFSGMFFSRVFVFMNKKGKRF